MSVVRISAGVIFAVFAVTLVTQGWSEAGLRVLVRVTARLALVAFVLAFAASSVSALAAPRARWWRRNRRALGHTFALAMVAHMAAFMSLGFLHADSFWQKLATSSLIGGAVGYVLIGTMTLTSFPRPAKWLGRRAWNVLHKSGMYVFWSIFAASYVGILGRRPIAFAALGLLSMALLLRAAARVKAASRGTVPLTSRSDPLA